jgi:hypothetical protein
MLAATNGDAHKTITSRYTYNEHVFPILRERCGGCHFEGGPTPMSLLTYKDAMPWAESIREEMTAESMPPWFVDPAGPAVKGGHQLTARELDVVLTWATGGSPEGDPTMTPRPVTPRAPWRAGPPDLTLSMPREHTVQAGTIEESVDVAIPNGVSATRWVKAVDLQPGTVSMVRSVRVALETGQVLADWVPGYEATPAPGGAAFKLQPGAKLHLNIYYKKHYLDEQHARSDRSTIGLYFTEPPISGRELQTLTASAGAGGSADTRQFAIMVKRAARIVAITPSLDQRYALISVDAVLPAGRRVPLLRLHGARPEWRRRYWLAESVDVPPDTRVETTLLAATPGPLERPVTLKYPLEVSIDYVGQDR